MLDFVCIVFSSPAPCQVSRTISLIVLIPPFPLSSLSSYRITLYALVRDYDSTPTPTLSRFLSHSSSLMFVLYTTNLTTHPKLYNLGSILSPPFIPNSLQEILLLLYDYGYVHYYNNNISFHTQPHNVVN